MKKIIEAIRGMFPGRHRGKDVALVLGGGGAFAYVKFIKPKQGVKVSANPDEYNFEDEEYLTEDESGDIKDN